MNTDLQRKKPLSPKRRLSKNAEVALKITENKWWPFDRVDPKILQRLHKQHINNLNNLDPALF